MNSKRPLEPFSHARGAAKGRRGQAVVVASALYLVTLRPVRGEDRAGLDFLWYQEERGRIEVWGPSFFAEKEIAPWLNLRLEGVYNAISGATPTGEPAGRRTTTIEVRESSTTRSTVSKKVFHTVSGPSGTTRKVATTETQAVSNTVTTVRKETIVLADHEHLPTQEISDEREGVNALLSAKLGPGVLGVNLAYSTERDYESLAGALKWTQEFNKKNTVLDAGIAYAHDEADLFTRPGSAGKDSVDFHLGLSQVIDRRTVVDFNATLGSASGYLDDQYKVVLLGNDVVPENRPSYRRRGTLGVDVKRYIEPLGASIEAGYRFGSDTFGVTSNTASVTWRQKLGEGWLLSVGGRAYWQSAGDFYAVSFTGNPDHYSSDYRLSALRSFSLETRLTWKAKENLSLSLGYERYEMHGRDHLTSAEAYPTANVFTAGAQLWF